MGWLALVIPQSRLHATVRDAQWIVNGVRGASGLLVQPPVPVAASSVSETFQCTRKTMALTAWALLSKRQTATTTLAPAAAFGAIGLLGLVAL